MEVIFKAPQHISLLSVNVNQAPTEIGQLLVTMLLRRLWKNKKIHRDQHGLLIKDYVINPGQKTGQKNRLWATHLSVHHS
jgi:hypothetical protein